MVLFLYKVEISLFSTFFQQNNIQKLYVFNMTNGEDSFNNCTDNENEDDIIAPKCLFLPVAGGLIFVSPISFRIYTTLKRLINNKQMDKSLYPILPIK